MLYRLHGLVALINLIALIADTLRERYINSIIEFITILFICLAWRYLHVKKNLPRSAYIFLIITSFALLAHIYFNQFATMALLFILLLPLSTLLFIPFKHSVWISFAILGAMSALLYYESLHNPQNPLTQNHQALITLAYTTAVIYAFGILYHLSIIKTVHDLDKADRQKALLLGEVHHRVKNNLNVIASIIGLQANQLESQAKDELNKAKGRVESISMVHEMLYKCDDFAQIEVQAYMQRLCDLVINLYEKDIQTTISSQVKTLPLEIMVQLGMIANELLTNSLKHAFSSEDGKITIQITKDEQFCHFEYTDNGIGIDNCKPTDSSIGLKLVRLATKQLGGKLDCVCKNGTKYTIRFPYEKS